MIFLLSGKSVESFHYVWIFEKIKSIKVKIVSWIKYFDFFCDILCGFSYSIWYNVKDELIISFNFLKLIFFCSTFLENFFYV